MDIILDTNIFRNDFFFKSNDFEVLKDYLKKTDSDFILPEIILEEINGVYRKVLEERIQNFNKAGRELSAILNKKNEDLDIDIDNQVVVYVDFVQKNLNIKKNKIVPYNNDYLPELVRRAIARQKPFKDEDKGFRDSIIWLTILDYCKKCKEKQVIFISNNSTDFGDVNIVNALHSQLITEMNELGVRVNYFNTTKNFIEAHSKKIDFINKDWIVSKIDEDWLSEEICEFIDQDHHFIISWYEDKLGRESTNHYTAVRTFIIDYQDYFIYEMVDDSLVINISINTENEIEFEHYSYDSLSDSYYRNTDHETRYFQTFLNVELVFKNKEITEIEVTDFG